MMNERLLREWVAHMLHEAGNLSAPQMLGGRTDRWDIFLKKMKSGGSFSDLEDNEFTIPIVGNKELTAALKAKDPDAYKLAFVSGVKTVPPNAISAPTKLKKTQDFGGLPPGGRLQKEMRQIRQLRSAIAAIAPVDIDVGKKDAVGVVGVDDVEGTPKADCVLVNAKGKIVAAISLKDADDPTQMQQWGGITNYKDHPEIKAFVEDLREVQASSSSGRIETAYFRPLKDVKLARKLCYGDKSSVENNCNVIIASQVPIKISKSGQIIATNVFYAPKIPPKKWRPTLWATHRTKRGVGFGLKDIRIGCYPLGWGSTRSNEPLPTSGRRKSSPGTTWEVDKPMSRNRKLGAKGQSPKSSKSQYFATSSGAEKYAARTETLIRALIRESLLTEELTKSDKKEIERIARKQAAVIIKRDALDQREIEKLATKKAEEAIKKALGVSFIGTKGDINKFVADNAEKGAEKWLKDKAGKQQVADVAKTIIKKLYKQLAVTSPQIIDRIKV